jgi:hypothetical protein
MWYGPSMAAAASIPMVVIMRRSWVRNGGPGRNALLDGEGRIGRNGRSAAGPSIPTLASVQKRCGVGAPDRIRTCGLYLRRVALYPAELRVPVTRNYSSLIPPVNDALTRLKPVRVADHLMAFTCRRLRRSFRRGGCNVVATLPVNVDRKTSLPLTPSIHYQSRPAKRHPALTSSPSEGGALSS